MRLIGHLKEEASAKTFSGYLVSREIRNLVEPDAEGWAIWIHSEDQLEAGQQALAGYLQNAKDPKYQIGSQQASALEAVRQREEANAAKRIRGPDQIWSRSGLAPLTLSLIGISVAVTLGIGLDPTFHDIRWLAISQVDFGFLLEVRAGQVWRLITPIFVHFGPLHLLFNMLWLRDLGAMIEVRQGMPKFALLVVVLAITSNIGQYLWDGPSFGGMSGVLYGLFGYIWLRSQCDPNSGLGLSSTTVWSMMIWFFLCIFGVFGMVSNGVHVANGAHAVGLIVGALWGAAPMAKRLLS